MNGHTNSSGIIAGRQSTEKTDYTRWRLKDDRGKQTWHYIDHDEEAEWPQSTADKYHLGLPTVLDHLFYIKSSAR